MSDDKQKQPGADQPAGTDRPDQDAQDKTAADGKPKGGETAAAGKAQDKQQGKAQGKSQDQAQDKSQDRSGTDKPGAKDQPAQSSPEAKTSGAKKDTPKGSPKDSGTPPKPGAKTKSGRSGLWGFLVLILLLAAGAAGGGAWYLWQRLQHQSQAFDQRLGKLDSRLQQAESDRRAATSKLESQLESLREQQKSAQNAIEVLRSKTGRSETEWRVAEAEYLIRIANDRLKLARDVPTALAALQAADDRLRRAGDPALLDARKRLAHDIQALRSVDQPDVPGLSLALGGLIDEVDKLPLNSPQPSKAAEPPGSAAGPAKAGGWRQALKGVWEELKGLIVVRHPEHPAQPLLPPSQRFFLTQNLRLQLEQARLALLRGDAADYRRRIATAQEWIRTYFDVDAAATRGALDTLARLAKRDVHPSLPDISGALRTLEQFRAKLHNGSKAPAAPGHQTGTNAAPAKTQDQSAPAAAPQQDPAR